MPVTVSLSEDAILKRREAGRRSYYKHIEERREYYRELSKRRRESDPAGYSAYQKKWSAENKDRVNANKRKRRAARRAAGNPEKTYQTAEKRRSYYLANQDKWRARYKRWSAKNPGKERLRANKRRAAVRLATPPWADEKKMEVIYARARELTLSTGVMHDVDHILPLRAELVCGLHCEDNLQILTEVENSRKRNQCP